MIMPVCNNYFKEKYSIEKIYCICLMAQLHSV